MSLPLMKPMKIGSIELKNRIIMAPLTRSRADGSDGRTPNALMKEHYVQRATAGMIITEATAVTPMGVGYANTPGIWSEAHISGWKKITEAVHAAGGKIILQLWHVGRVSHPIFLNGETPVAPSAVLLNGHVSLVRPQVNYVLPRALESDEIPDVIEAYRQGAENALKAGFDGVEIHGANGYLLDQFLHDGTNLRTDLYGGSVENRARLMLEVTDVVISVWGADRVGMHLAPRGDAQGMSDKDPFQIFSYVFTELNKRKIAFICAREFQALDSLAPKLRKLFKGVYIGNEKFNFETADQAITSGDFEAIAFGKYFIANPDLVKRYELKAPLNELNPATIYAEGSIGYTDYPFLPNSF